MLDQPTPLVNEALLNELEVLVVTAAPFIEPALQHQVNSVVQLSKRLPPFDPRHRGLQPLLMELLNTLTERCRTRVFAATASTYF